LALVGVLEIIPWVSVKGSNMKKGFGGFDKLRERLRCFGKLSNLREHYRPLWSFRQVQRPQEKANGADGLTSTSSATTTGSAIGKCQYLKIDFRGS